MSKPKVLIVHNYYQIPGGEDTVVKNESTMLEENGHEVLLYTRHNDEIKNRGVFGKVKLFFESIFSLKTYKDVKRIIKEEKIDIVHVHNTLPLISPSVYYAAFSMEVPVVQTIHNFRLLCPGATFTRNGQICEECLENGLKSALKHKCYRNSFIQTFSIVTMMKIHRMLKTYQKVNGFITLTEFNREKLKLLIKHENKIFVKPNFVKKDVLQCTERKMENYFVYFGRLDKLKGVDLIVDTWKEIKDSNLIIIGDGPLRKEIENTIIIEDLNNVKLVGFLPREKAFRIIEKSKAVIMASQWYEGFPMTIVESLSLGVPVVSGDIGNLGSIINHDKNGLLFKFDSKEDLRGKIELLINDIEVNERLSDGAFKTFIENYDDKINYGYLNDIYSELIYGVNREKQYVG